MTDLGQKTGDMEEGSGRMRGMEGVGEQEGGWRSRVSGDGWRGNERDGGSEGMRAGGRLKGSEGRRGSWRADARVWD